MLNWVCPDVHSVRHCVTEMTADLAIFGGTLCLPSGVRPGTLIIRDGQINGVLPPGEQGIAYETIDASGLHILPGAIDIHCHIRSPAYPQRGTVESETSAALAGGISTVFEMPITDPCCNSVERVRIRRDHFAQTARSDFALYAAPATLTQNNFEALAEAGIIALKIFTTSPPQGRSAEFEGLSWTSAVDQAQVLRLAAKVGLPVVVHAENQDILTHAEVSARALDPSNAATHNAARPPLAEALAVAQLLTLNIEAQAKLHIAHVTSEGVLDILRRFAGTSDFSAETCPHYLMHDEEDVAKAGVCGKINPPIRYASDKTALWQALADGTLDHVTTDHAAFTTKEKAAAEGDFLSAPPGHPGLEVLLPSLLEGVAAGKINLSRAVDLVSTRAAQRFCLPQKGSLVSGANADITIVDLAAETVIEQNSLKTAARANARLSHGKRYRGRVVRTLLGGKTVWDGSTVVGTHGRGCFVRPKLS